MVTLLNANARSQRGTVLMKMASQLKVFSFAPQNVHLSHRLTTTGGALRASKLGTTVEIIARAYRVTGVHPTVAGPESSLQSVHATMGRTARTATHVPARPEWNRTCVTTEKEEFWIGLDRAVCLLGEKCNKYDMAELSKSGYLD
jgi:hypothetical protein